MIMLGSILLGSASCGPDASLIHAAKGGHQTTAQLMLTLGADINAQDSYNPYGHTPLIWAVRFRNLEMVKWLLSKGADINGRDYYNQTPLIVAATWPGSPEIIEYLVSNHADLEAKDIRGRTALMHAASDPEHAGSMKILLANGADIRAMDIFRNTVLYYALTSYASRDCRIQKAGLLVAAGADPTDTTWLEQTTNMTSQERQELVEWLKHAQANK